MTEILIFGAIALVLLTTLVWLLWPRTISDPEVSKDRLQDWRDFSDLHCRHFYAMKQAFSAADKEFLRRRASAILFQRWSKERRQIIRTYLCHLRGDLIRMTKTARAVSVLSPQVSVATEGELLFLSMRFQFFYLLIQTRLFANRFVLLETEKLADLVGGLAASVERALKQAAEVPEQSQS